VKRALLAAALLFGCLVAPVAAHEELALHSLTVLDSVSPELESVDLHIAHLGAPAFVVSNPTAEPLTVLDGAGRPFLEIGPRGVRADVSSRLFYRSVVPGTHDRLRPKASDGPNWVTFSRAPRWTWFDPRLEPGTSTHWDVAMLYGDRPVEVSGGFEPLAHHGHFVNELEAPTVQGLDVRLVQGPVPAVYVRNDTNKVLEVVGAADEPFLRVGPHGVFANLMSPSYYSAGALTIERVPRWADATAAPRWKRVSRSPVWAWLEYRAAVSSQQQYRDELGSTPRVVHTWTSPMTLGGEDLDMNGRVRWIPPDSMTPKVDRQPHQLLPRGLLLGSVIVLLTIYLTVTLRRPRTSTA
jgi:hypothetical protein